MKPVARPFGAKPRFAVTNRKLVPGGHLGHNEPCAELAGYLPKRPVRDTGHRRQEDAILNDHMPDRQWRRQALEEL